MILLLWLLAVVAEYGKLKQFDQIGPKGQFLMEYGIFDKSKMILITLLLLQRRKSKVSKRLLFRAITQSCQV